MSKRQRESIGFYLKHSRHDALVGSSVKAIDTPALVIDLDAMEANMRIMRDYAEKKGMLLRPHAKCHKSSYIANMQIHSGGAVGICVQKPSEAEAMHAGGINDIFISNQVVCPMKLRRVALLARKLHAAGGKLTIAVDSMLGVDNLAAAMEWAKRMVGRSRQQQLRPSFAEFEEEDDDGVDEHFVRLGSEPSDFATEEAVGRPEFQGVGGILRAIGTGRRSSGRQSGVLSGSSTDFKIGVFLEVDVGQGRCGVRPGTEGVPIIEHLVRTHGDHLYFAGIHAYHGAAQHIRSYDERKQVILASAKMAEETKKALASKGITTPLVTGAGTGTFTIEATSGVFGELQPGSYIVMDHDYDENAAATPDHPVFKNALFVKSMVMSKASDGSKAVCDAGHKSHAIDTGLPRVHHPRGIAFDNGGDDHGILTAANSTKNTKGGGSAKSSPRSQGRKVPLPELGETVWIVPNHCDPTFNLYDEAVGVRGGLHNGHVECIIPVDARGHQS